MECDGLYQKIEMDDYLKQKMGLNVIEIVDIHFENESLDKWSFRVDSH